MNSIEIAGLKGFIHLIKMMMNYYQKKSFIY